MKHRAIHPTAFIALRLALLTALFVPAAVRCDDVFLVNGFVYRNVRVVDSTAAAMRISFNGNGIDIQRAMIDHIERRGLDNSRKAVYELYSKEKYDAFDATRKDVIHAQEVADSARDASRDSVKAAAAQAELDEQFQSMDPASWEQWNSDRRQDSLDWAAHGITKIPRKTGLFCGVGWSYPGGTLIDMGFRMQYFELGLWVTRSDYWSHGSDALKIALAMRIHPIKYSNRFDPYIGIAGGELVLDKYPASYVLGFIGVRSLLPYSISIAIDVGLLQATTTDHSGQLIYGHQVQTYPYIGTELRLGI